MFTKAGPFKPIRKYRLLLPSDSRCDIATSPKIHHLEGPGPSKKACQRHDKMGGAGGTASSHVHNHSRLLHITDCLHQQKGATHVHRVEFFGQLAWNTEWASGASSKARETQHPATSTGCTKTPSHQHQRLGVAGPRSPAPTDTDSEKQGPRAQHHRLGEAGPRDAPPATKIGRGRATEAKPPATKIGGGSAAKAQPPATKIGRGRATKAKPPATKIGKGRATKAEPPASKIGRGGLGRHA